MPPDRAAETWPTSVQLIALGCLIAGVGLGVGFASAYVMSKGGPSPIPVMVWWGIMFLGGVVTVRGSQALMRDLHRNTASPPGSDQAELE